MDSKEFTKLFYFIFGYEKLKKDTRYVLLALMQVQNIFFKTNEDFKVQPSYFKYKYNIHPKRLDYNLEYLSECEWITCKKFEDFYSVNVNYEKIARFRERVVSQYKESNNTTKSETDYPVLPVKSKRIVNNTNVYDPNIIGKNQMELTLSVRENMKELKTV